MGLQRTTFSESWYRIAELKPCMHPSLNVFRQTYRGELWFVLEDLVNNQYFRITYPAHQFLSLLDGKRDIDTVWKLALDMFGDEAPTQGEVIQLLGQLYNSNLLLGDIPANSQGLLKRYNKRVQSEIKKQVTNVLFMKIPLWDPDRFLNALSPFFGWLFTRFGIVFWFLAALIGLVYAAGRAEYLTVDSSAILSMSNIPLLYIAFAGSKLLHELGHAFACKHFGIRSGGGGQIHKMGVMLMLLTPVPFVDCSSSWAFRNKWNRAVVGMAGLMVDLLIAAVSVVIWSQTAEGSVIHAISYNVIFVTSVSTLLFNGNPLMRYDAYYILSDVLEIPNLASRGNSYFLYLCRKYILGVTEAQYITGSPRERVWLAGYSVASFMYRSFVMVGISLFIADVLFLFGLIFGGSVLYRMFLKPVYTYSVYLFSNGELRRCRRRAMVISFGSLVMIILAISQVSIPDRVRIEGIVEPVELKTLYSQVDGFLISSETKSDVVKGDALCILLNKQLETSVLSLKYQIRQKELEYRQGYTVDPVKAQIFKKQLEALKKSMIKALEKVAYLTVRAPASGIWLTDNLKDKQGAYIPRGTELGRVVGIDNYIVRAVASQDQTELLMASTGSYEIRVKGRPEQFHHATLSKALVVGLEKLPSAALGYAAGGQVQTDGSDQMGRKAAENFFEIQILPEQPAMTQLVAGQVLVIRCDLEPKSIGAQLWRAAKQQFMKRFRVL